MNFTEIKNALIEKEFGNMNDRQFEAVTTVEGPLLVLAGAGSGKTTVLVNRIAYLCKYGNAYKSSAEPRFTAEQAKAALAYVNGETDASDYGVFAAAAQNPPKPYMILAITFTNKAAGELKERIEKKLGGETDIWAGTFHRICGRILRAHGDRIGYSSHFTVYDTDDQKRLMKDIIKSSSTDEKLFTPKSVLSRISSAKDSLITPAEMTKDSGSDFRLKTVAALYTEYQKRLLASDAMDFDDMITNTVRLLHENPDILEKYRSRFKYIMVDEYQDTNYAQYVLVNLLAGKNGNLCVVGDDDQSIYRFRGATIENILNFEDDYESAKVIRLEQNYRSTGNILDAANGIIKNNKGRKGKRLWTDLGEGQKITVYTARDERDEARYVADRILEDVHAGAAFKDCAVLYRTNAQSAAFENVFSKSGIAYAVIGGFRFYERKEIKDVLAYLNVINNKQDAVRLKRIINEPKRGIGAATVSRAEELAAATGLSLFEVFESADEFAAISRAAAKLKEFCNMINTLEDAAAEKTLPELFDALITATGYRESLLLSGEPDAADRVANIDELKNDIAAYCEETDDPSLSAYLEEKALISDLDSMDENADRATLMTVHAAKGLEFPFVFLVGMEEGVFPGNQSIYGGPDDIEEERRLAYVAVTRAKRSLTVTRAASRMLYGQTGRNLPSRFLNEIPKKLCEFSSAEPQFGFSDGYGFYKTPADGGSVHVFGGGKSFAVSKNQNGNRGGFSSSLLKKPSASGGKSGAVYSIGQSVQHKTFGDGIILSVTDMGNDTLLEIAFSTAGTKKLMANYAKLKIL